MIQNNIPQIITETFDEEEIRIANKNNQILLLDLETNYTCNLNCVYCFTRETRANRGKIILPFDKIKNIIDQAIKCGVKTIDIIGGGEPIIYKSGDKNLLDIVEYITKIGIRIEIFTNGLTLGDNELAYSIFGMGSKELARKLFDKKVTVFIKLNSRYVQIKSHVGQSLLKFHLTTLAR